MVVLRPEIALLLPDTVVCSSLAVAVTLATAEELLAMSRLA
jgi:hypothetical protein